MRIESGTGRAALMRQGFVVLVFLGLAVWFGYDGWFGYPRENVKTLVQNFPKAPDKPVATDSRVTEESVQSAQQDLAAAGSRQVSMTDLSRQWGEPAWLGSPDPNGSAGRDQVAFFVGTYGMAKAALKDGVVTRVEWIAGPKGRSDIQIQQLLAIGLAAPGLVLLVRLLRLVSARYVLDDRGLSLPGLPTIPYEQMTEMDTSLLEKGVVRVAYRDDRGQAKVALLDDEQIAQFDEIVLALTEKKGWELPAPKDESPADADDKG